VREKSCPFCDPLPQARIFYRDQLVIGLWDAFPVSAGHALLVPVRHVPTWFSASSEERIALTRAIDFAREAIEAKHRPDGYNIGINSGDAAGQTVFHLHVHVIPRYRGDVPDPRGGLRHVIPGRGNYLSEIRVKQVGQSYASPTERVLFTGGDDPLLPLLKDHLTQSNAVDIAVAFTMRSGLELIHPYLEELLGRKGRLRILTGDYLGTTEPDALLRLLDLEGDIERRVFETAGGHADMPLARSFHPKAYVFHHRDGSSAAFVGSSNLSANALTVGVEWNYRVISWRNGVGFSEIERAFEALFHSPATVELTPEWVAEYRIRRPHLITQVAEEWEHPYLSGPSPHSIQQEALRALDATREQGRKAGLVVLATGLGKTWLSAFDSAPFKRVLFVAHREEILGQALQTFRRIRPHDYLGRYTGQEKSAGAAVLFASIQTLSRREHLQRFAPEEFDYIVVDEFHHAEARTYRRLIDYFRPTFSLGLTATPERTDGADLLALCDQNLVYRCDLTEGIRRELLCPFRYFGVPDDVDYRNIPWRNKRFDLDELTAAVATQARAENCLDQYRKRAGKRTIAFCVSQRHADFMADFFRKSGLRSVAVHSGLQTAPRAKSLEQLRDGELDVICSVDILNEGVDLPELDTVMMLRPTESRIIWLQQFGRGLRRGNFGKKLTVIDYIGNHRTFLMKPQTLFGLPAGDRHIMNLLESLDAGTAEIPPGCEVTYELEAKDILKALLRVTPDPVDLIRRRYQDFLEIHGVRPSASELYLEGYNPRAVRREFGSWLSFVKSEGGFAEMDERAFQESREFLEALETTEMARSYKMLLLLAMLNANQVPGSLRLNELAQQVARVTEHYPKLAADVGAGLNSLPSLEAMLVRNPIAAWVGGRGTGGRSYFAYEGDVFSMTTDVSPENREALQELVRELVDWRLAEYLDRPSDTTADSYTLKISHSGGQPILFLPSRAQNPGLPEGWIDVRVSEVIYSANFVKVAVNVMRQSGSETNVLPELLRKWFGPDTGAPGTRHRLLLRRTGAAWNLEPLGAVTLRAVLWKAYQREEIAPLFGLSYSEALWNQGFVRQDEHTFLFVTLQRPSQVAGYQNHFLSPRTFQWESQNRTAQSSKHGRSICDHSKLGISVHLFVRERSKLPGGRGAPFTYCGPVEFVSWEGEKPVTVIWNLSEPIPVPLRDKLQVPQGDGGVGSC
jgi:superfamily II DNA or RNA helicase/HKD family nuclease/diadenosine tetraphosphate (Ap4A) HIT family hydrolase